MNSDVSYATVLSNSTNLTVANKTEDEIFSAADGTTVFILDGTYEDLLFREREITVIYG